MSDDEERELDADERAVRDRRLLETLDEERQVEQVRALLAQEPVRDFIWRILTKCHVFGSVFHTNYGQMSLSEGGRQIGLWLLSVIGEADPEALLTMQLKANQVAKLEAEQRRKGAQRRSRQT